MMLPRLSDATIAALSPAIARPLLLREVRCAADDRDRASTI